MNLDLRSPLAVAAERACLTAVVVAGSAFFGALAQGASLRVAGITAGVAFFGILVVRFGVEGTIDQVGRSVPTPQTPVAPTTITGMPPGTKGGGQ